jgi:ribosomal protein S12 methylthiotransferase
MQKIGFVSLGCAKNLVDSERIITQLKSEGYEIVTTYDEANLVIINTCGFINEAIEESLETISDALDKNGKVIVTGCLGTKKEKIIAHHPNVLHISGPNQHESLMAAIHKHLPPPKHKPFIDLIPACGIKLTPPHYAYLKISEGCNHHCSFCIIPQLRGKLVSRPMKDIMGEAKNLVESGVKELIIVSQDTSSYGMDLDHKTNLFNLANELSKLDIWIRLHYLYPYPNIDNIISLMAEEKVLPYLDIPFQHVNPRILKLMHRPANQEKTFESIQRWRQICPDVTIRSTFIVGFPGETEEEFAELLDFLEEAQLDRVGCFKYSPVEGAKANELADHISETEKEDRLNALMMLQTEISANKLENKIGKTMQVMIDEVNDNNSIGRTKGDAPEVDGVVYIKETKSLKPGNLANVFIESTDDHDLHGRLT